MPWYQVAYRPEVVENLAKIDPVWAQRIFDKTKWLASNVENLRHEPLAPDLTTFSQYAVGDWRIIYSIDREEQLIDIHLVGTRQSLYPASRKPGTKTRHPYDTGEIL